MLSQNFQIEAVVCLALVWGRVLIRPMRTRLMADTCPDWLQRDNPITALAAVYMCCTMYCAASTHITHTHNM